MSTRQAFDCFSPARPIDRWRAAHSKPCSVWVLLMTTVGFSHGWRAAIHRREDPFVSRSRSRPSNSLRKSQTVRNVRNAPWQCRFDTLRNFTRTKFSIICFDSQRERERERERDSDHLLEAVDFLFLPIKRFSMSIRGALPEFERIESESYVLSLDKYPTLLSHTQKNLNRFRSEPRAMATGRRRRSRLSSLLIFTNCGWKRLEAW